MKATNFKYLLFGLVLVVVGFFASFSPSSAVSREEMIQSLMEQIKALQAQLINLQNNPDTPSRWCYDFKHNLRIDDKGKEIIALHKALENDGLGPFDRGGDNFNAFEVFTEETASAVVGFQEKYKDEILIPNNLKYGTGFIGKNTRAKLNQLYGCKTKAAVRNNYSPSSSSSSLAITETYVLKIITSIETDDHNAWGEVTNYNKAENTTEIFNSSYKNLCGTYGHNPAYKTKYRSYGNSVCEVYYPVSSVVDLTVGSYGSFKEVSLSGENCSGGQCLVVMNGNKTIYARFNKEIAFIEILSPTRGAIWTTNPGQAYQVKWKTSGIALDSQGYILLKSITPHSGHYVVEESVALNGGSSSDYGGSRNFIIPNASSLLPAGYYVIRIGLGRYEDYDEARARSVFFDSVPFEIVTMSKSSSSLVTTCNNEPLGMPIITSLSSYSGPVGTKLEIRGCNLSGFESDLDVVFVRSDGAEIPLYGGTWYPGYGGSSEAGKLIMVTVQSYCASGSETGRYSGITSPCTTVQATPGVYKVYATAWGKKSNEVSFTITATVNTPSITIISPNGGEELEKGANYPITWSSENLGDLTLSIDLVDSNGYVTRSIVNNIKNASPYNWLVPQDLPGGSYKILVSSNDKGPSAQDYSDNYFIVK